MENNRGGDIEMLGDRAVTERGTGSLFASPDKPAKTKAIQPAAVRAKIREVRLHLYLGMPQTVQEYMNFLDYSWDKTGFGPFGSMGVDLTPLEDKKNGVEAFRKSLMYPGTIAVYMGHTSLTRVRDKMFVATALAPGGSKNPTLRNSELVAVLGKAKANIVILAGCSTDSCLSKPVKNDAIVITTASGKDGVTNSANWARAIASFLLALVGWDFDGKTVTHRADGTATVNEAILASNKLFPKGDSFVLASGNGNIREF